MNTQVPIVYGSKVSYFTGKLEAYLRYKEIPYQFKAMTGEYFNRIVPEKTGAQQMPAMEFPDGRWATDTTPIIDWFESEYPDHPILPGDPLQAYICRLIEDYADEWLWRPAMHYRWSHYLDRQFLGTLLVEEMLDDIKGPGWIKRWQVRRRQKSNFVDKDGVNPGTRAHVEQGYLKLLDILEPVLSARPYLFGERPTLADIGLMGPLFRHFAQDPTPAEIMRLRAPAVFAWVARMWNSKASCCADTLLPGIPEDLLPLLREIGETHLPNLVANAQAWQQGKEKFDVSIQGTQYVDLPVSRYRSWCLEQLQMQFQALPEEAREPAQTLLQSQGCWQPLWQVSEPRSNYDPDGLAPFGAGLKVYPLGGV